MEAIPNALVLSITPTKLSPEAHSNHIIPRSGLHSRLEAGLQRRAVVVTAAAGYGKSTLLSSYLASAGCPVIWYRLHEDDGDPQRFLLHLTEGCRRHVPKIARFDGQMASDDHFRRNPHIILAPLIAQLADFDNRQMALVLDDYHAVSHSPAIEYMLDYILKYLPANLHLCISSRCDATTPELARLRQYGEVLDLSEVDLAFTAEETKSLLHSWGICDVTTSSVQKIVDQTHGWAAALQMVCQQLAKHGGSVEEFLSQDLSGFHRPMYDYLALHVLQAQPPAIQRFMEKTSFLFQITPAAANSLLGIANAGKILDELYHDHALISYLGLQAGQPVYRYHSLFQDFLRTRLLDREGENPARELHLECGRFFESEEKWEAAFHHYCKGKHWSSASRIVRVRATRLISIGQMAPIREWLSRIPEGVLESDPWLLLYRGRILHLEDSVQRATVTLQHAERMFRVQKDRLGISRTLFERARIAYDQRQPSEALRLLEEAFSNTLKDDHYLRAGIHSYSILVYAACGRFVEAADSYHKAMPLLERVKEPGFSLVQRIRAMRRMALAQLQHGKVRAALQLAEQGYKLCQAETLDGRSTGHCLHVLAVIYAAKGDFEKATALLDDAAEIAARQGLTVLLNRVQGAKADILATNHEPSRAECIYAVADRGSSDSGGLAYVRLRQGRLAEARQICLSDLEDAHEREAPLDVARATALLGLIAVESGDMRAAEQRLLDSAGQFDRLQAEYGLAGVRLHLAKVYYAKGQLASCRRYLTEALQFAEREQCFNFFLWMPDTVARLAAEALRQNLAQEYLEKLFAQRMSLAELHFFLPLLNEVDSELHEVANRLVLNLAGLNYACAGYADQLLAACKDEYLRSRLASALSDQRLTVAGILRLRHTYNLTWREIDIFAQYYVPSRNSLGDANGGSDLYRASVARNMCITDNTLRYHINSIRRKLSLLGRKGGISVYQWALGERIVGQFADSLPH